MTNAQSAACGLLGLRSRAAMTENLLGVIVDRYGNAEKAAVASLANGQLVYRVKFFFVDDYKDATRVSDR